MEKEKHQRSKEEAEIIAYLLGTLTEIEADDFEQRYLEDSALFAEMQEVEDELIDDYASGAMGKDDRIRFEQHFLQSPDRRERVRFARAITGRAVSSRNERERVTSPTPLFVAEPAVMASKEETQERGKLLPFRRLLRPVPAWREWGAIAAAILIAIFTGVLWLRNRELHRDLLTAAAEETQLAEQVKSHSVRADQAEARIVEKNTQIQDLTEQVKVFSEQARSVSNGIASAFIGLEYLTRTTRGGSEGKLKIIRLSPRVVELRLGLEFEATALPDFKATLLDKSSKPLWSSHGSLKNGISGEKKQRITLTIPGRVLIPGEYQVVLTAPLENNAEIARYRLQIMRE